MARHGIPTDNGVRGGRDGTFRAATLSCRGDRTCAALRARETGRKHFVWCHRPTVWLGAERLQFAEGRPRLLAPGVTHPGQCKRPGVIRRPPITHGHSGDQFDFAFFRRCSIGRKIRADPNWANRANPSYRLPVETLRSGSRVACACFRMAVGFACSSQEDSPPQSLSSRSCRSTLPSASRSSIRRSFLST